MGKQSIWLTENIEKYGWKTGAELGLGKCHTSRKLLRDTDILLTGVDHAARPHWKERQLQLKRDYPDRFTLYQTTTTKAAKLVEDESFDYVFVDAGHSYKSVKADIENWYSKVKPGGCFCGHDYNKDTFKGVVQAVSEAFPDHNVIHEYRIWYIFKE